MSLLLPTIKALGTIWVIEIFVEITLEKRQIILDDLTLFISGFENTFSRFRPDSLISRLNRQHSLDFPSADFIQVLKLGLKIFDRTGGLMNLMVGDRLIAQGYDDRYSFTPNGKITNIPNPHEVLLISESNITLKEGSIDMGGYGKGLLIDLISKRLLQHHFIPYFLINGGGDIFATSDEGEPITIYLEHPTKTDTYLTTTTIRNQGFAASSPHKRAWKHNGSLYSHIINPRPQTDQSNIDATFIKAPAACTADIFATTAIICSASELEGFSKKENLAVALYSLEKNSLTKNALF